MQEEMKENLIKTTIIEEIPKRTNKFHKKPLKNDRVLSHFKHGKGSDYIKKIRADLKMNPLLNEVQKMELDSYIQEMAARTVAVDVDSYINRLLIDRVRDLDAELVSYESDLYSTQSKLADSEKDIMFHKKVLNDLKTEYLNESTQPERKKDILEEIDTREDAIKKHQRLIQQFMDLRNKIRREVDKKETSQKLVKLKEQQLEGQVIDITEIMGDKKNEKL